MVSVCSAESGRAVLLARYCVSDSEAEIKAQGLKQADVNRDGEVSIIDVVMARAHIVGNSELGMYQIADGDMNGAKYLSTLP